jgi:hypothetical protein
MGVRKMKGGGIGVMRVMVLLGVRADFALRGLYII